MGESESVNLCRLCGEAGTVDLWAGWRRCLVCGSDSGPNAWEDIRHRYNRHYIEHHAGISAAEVEMDMRANLDWFGHHAAACRDRSFIDIGCSDGAALRGMASRGWSVHGFDIVPEAKELSPPGEHITVAERFSANIFRQRFSAILCREVIEHVPGWRDFLYECWHATQVKGLFQVQTPRPTATFNPIGYQDVHLHLSSPAWLRYWLERIGFDVIEMRLWDMGQVFLCRRPF